MTDALADDIVDKDLVKIITFRERDYACVAIDRCDYFSTMMGTRYYEEKMMTYASIVILPQIDRLYYHDQQRFLSNSETVIVS